MHLSYRFFTLLGGAAAVSFAFAAYQAVSETHVLERELGRQARVLAETQQQHVASLIQSGFLAGFAANR